MSLNYFFYDFWIPGSRQWLLILLDPVISEVTKFHTFPGLQKLKDSRVHIGVLEFLALPMRIGPGKGMDAAQARKKKREFSCFVQNLQRRQKFPKVKIENKLGPKPEQYIA